MGANDIPKKLAVIVVLVLLLASSVFASISLFQANSVNAQINSNTTSSSTLNQYEWTQFQGDASFTRFSAGPAPNTPNILWKANIAGIQPYITAFNGMIFVGTNTSIVALDQAGNTLWKTEIPMNKTWPIAYKIDDSHLVVESSCLDISTRVRFCGQAQLSPLTQASSIQPFTVQQKKCSTSKLIRTF